MGRIVRITWCMDALKISLASAFMLTAAPLAAQDVPPVPAPAMLEEAVRAQTGIDSRETSELRVIEAIPESFYALKRARNESSRIAQLELAEPHLNALIAFDDDVVATIITQAEALNSLKGRTILVKDNIETMEWATTAGSLALERNATDRDAPLIANIRANGGVILGKTNLSEWANFRSTNSSSGWSAVGGQTRNAHATDRSPCGSSSGSAVAVAAGMSWAAIGTETNGSITCPAAVNGIVGFKPTVGMVSRTHIVPISVSQDTAGPMACNVHHAALLLSAMAGSDPLDPATALADSYTGDFTAGLAEASLAGQRIGVLRNQVGDNAQVTALFAAALADMERAGAVLVEIDYAPDPQMWADEYTVLLYEFREGLNAYLAGSPADIPVRSLADVIAFNTANADTELRWFGQEILELAEITTDREAYAAARANSLRLAGAEGIDHLLAENDVAFLIAPTLGPAWTIDLVLGDRPGDGIGAGYLAAIAGTPHLTVPMGAVEGLPVGLSIMGARWNDHAVLQAGAAYERVRSAKLAEPTFGRWQEPGQ